MQRCGHHAEEVWSPCRGGVVNMLRRCGQHARRCGHMQRRCGHHAEEVWSSCHTGTVTMPCRRCGQHAEEVWSHHSLCHVLFVQEVLTVRAYKAEEMPVPIEG